MEDENLCMSNGYHDWQVFGVSGILPDQEVDLKCSLCDCTACLSFDETDMVYDEVEYEDELGGMLYE